MNQPFFQGAGEESIQVIKLWWILCSIGLLVFLGISVSIVLGLTKKLQPSDAKLKKGMYLATAITVIFLIGILIATFTISPKKSPANSDFTIQVKGKLWWWEITYMDKNSQVLFKTANEIHLPVNERSRLKLVTDNVIHSFWVPALGGKVDMIPGQTNEIALTPNQEGDYRGQCAEFCGIQHALMAFKVKVTNKNSFNDWLKKQTQVAIEPVSEKHRLGKDVFQNANCIRCHTIRGVSEHGDKGPDLTHIASRSTLLAATYPNTKGHMAGWILDPQSIKPGNLMPATPLESDDFLYLLHYLRSLK